MDAGIEVIDGYIRFRAVGKSPLYVMVLSPYLLNMGIQAILSFFLVITSSQAFLHSRRRARARLLVLRRW